MFAPPACLEARGRVQHVPPASTNRTAALQYAQIVARVPSRRRMGPLRVRPVSLDKCPQLELFIAFRVVLPEHTNLQSNPWSALHALKARFQTRHRWIRARLAPPDISRLRVPACAPSTQHMRGIFAVALLELRLLIGIRPSLLIL